MLFFELFPLFVTLVALVVGVLLFVTNRQAAAPDAEIARHDPEA